MTPDEIKRKSAVLHDEYSAMSDDDIRAEIIQWKPETIERHVGNRIIAEREKERDPTKTILADLASRIINIEQTATRHELKTWAFWMSLVALLLAAAMLSVMLWQWSLQQPNN